MQRHLQYCSTIFNRCAVDIGSRVLTGAMQKSYRSLTDSSGT